MNSFRAAFFLTVAPLMFAPACGDDDDDNGNGEEAVVELAGENEVPPVATTATGQTTAFVDNSTLVVDGDFSGLQSDLIEVGGTPAHVHEGDIDEAGPVLFDLDVDSTNMRSGTFSGRFEVTEEQRRLFEEGLLYVNVHTEDNPGGELRGQLIQDAPTFDAVDAEFDAELSAENETADVESDATGNAEAILRGDTMTVSGSFEGLTTPLQDVEDVGPAHIHEAPPGEDGPVVFPLQVMPEEDMRSGRFSTMRVLSAEEQETLREGNYYVNIHTENFPAGEIRGQLTER